MEWRGDIPFVLKVIGELYPSYRNLDSVQLEIFFRFSVCRKTGFGMQRGEMGRFISCCIADDFDHYFASESDISDLKRLNTQQAMFFSFCVGGPGLEASSHIAVPRKVRSQIKMNSLQFPCHI